MEGSDGQRYLRLEGGTGWAFARGVAGEWLGRQIVEAVEARSSVLPDIGAVLKACREAGISDFKDHLRRACVGKLVILKEIALASRGARPEHV